MVLCNVCDPNTDLVNTISRGYTSTIHIHRGYICCGNFTNHKTTSLTFHEEDTSSQTIKMNHKRPS